MIKRISILFILACCFGCDAETTLCKSDSECAFVCEAYATNRLLYSCNEGTCRCVAPELMVCTGDAEKDHCEGICNMYRPGTQAVCTEGYCDCQEPVQGGVE
ncbi:MAG: hypothetical protein J6A01_06880 [Proteobacteria bacterium]|nr:hypothetical protein [Pseudomonadota bacterium]